MEGNYNSLETQKERLESYCRSREGFEIFQVYEDGGFSGSSMERPSLRRMLEDIRQGKINCVLVYKLDRIARSVKDFHILADFFSEFGVNFISITQSFDTQSTMGRLLRNVLCDFAQFERELIADRTRDKLQQRAQKGLWNGGIPPYGYKREEKRLVLDPVESPRVKFMFDSFKARPSLSALRIELNSRAWYPRSGKRWGKSSIDNILRNCVYAGKIKFNEEISSGQQPQIIDSDTFELIQGLRRDYSHVTTKPTRLFLLKGLVKCSDCGSMMTPHYTQKRRKDRSIYRVPYYRCSKTMHHENGICSIKSVNAEQLERLVIADLEELSQNEFLFASATAEFNNQTRNQNEPIEKEMTEVRAQINEVESEMQEFVRALGKARVSFERLEKAIEVGEGEKRQLQARLESLAQKLNEKTVTALNAELVRKSLQDLRACFQSLTLPEQAEVLQCVLKDVILERDKVVLEIFELPEFRSGSMNRPRMLLG